MSTNFYLKLSTEVTRDMFINAHPLILRARPIIENHYTHHIGKSSFGWKFCFEAQYIDDQKIDSFQDWKMKILSPFYSVYDEYDREVPKEQFLALVDNHQNEPHSMSKEYPDYGHFTDDEGYEFTWNEFS